MIEPLKRGFCAPVRISSVVTPCIAAAEVLALLTEWALNMLVSIPADSIISFNHLAMVGDETGWCGLMRDEQLFVVPS